MSYPSSCLRDLGPRHHVRGRPPPLGSPAIEGGDQGPGFWVPLDVVVVLPALQQERAKDPAKDLLELLTEDAVDDEVHRRVQRHLAAVLGRKNLD